MSESAAVKPHEVRDPRTGKLLAVIDWERREVELRPYRHRRIRVSLDQFLAPGVDSKREVR